MANEVKVKVTADTKQATTALAGMKRSFGDIVQQTTGFNLAQLGATAAITGTISAVRHAITAYSDYSTQVERFSRSTGTTAEEASRIIQVADDFQVSVETMDASLRIALTNGFVPTIENLAILADKYKSIQDPAKRAAEMTKVYGRSWREIESLLDQGGDSIRDNAAAISEGMIVTQEGIDQNIKYKKSIDDLEDSWASLTYEVGKAAIPTLITQTSVMAKDVEMLRNGASILEVLRHNQIEYSLAVMSSQPGMEEWGARYQGMADAAAVASGEIVEGAKEITDEVQKAADKFRVDLVDAMNAVKSAEEDWMKGAGGDVAGALEEAGLKGDDYRTALSLIDEVMGTNLGMQQDYRDTVADLAKQYAEGKIKGDEFKTALGLMKDEYMPLNEQVQKANDQLWYLQQKWQWFQDHNQLDLTINVQQNGSIPSGATSAGPNAGSGGAGTGAPGETRGYASGGSYMVPAGFNENWNAGGGARASSGEVVTISPTININQQPGQSTDALAQAVVSRLGQLASKSRLSGGKYQGT